MSAVKKIERQAIINLAGSSYPLEVIIGEEGEVAMDIESLRAQTGMVTLDRGYGNTASCLSKITYLDGENGILRYRGYDIAELAEHCNFTQVIYLLLFGELPKAAEQADFTTEVAKHYRVPKDLLAMAASLPKTMHPMAALAALTQSLTAFYPEFNQADPSAELRHKSIAVALGHITTLAAVIHRNRSHLNIAPIDQKYDLTEHFHHHFFGKVGSDISINALHKLFILHADHEQNCSTSTVRLVGSSKAPLFAALSAGINALWGPLHGGANQAVLEMLQDIQRSGQDVKKILARAKDKQDTFRLMGFGHRVYKNFDPRAKIIKSACDSLLTQLEKADPMLDLAKELEQAALSDPYFIERKLYPNVDFYSGIIYRALGIPVDMFTVMFAVGRLPGWLAHWQEMVTAGDMRIGRPRQIYTGPTSRPVPKG